MKRWMILIIIVAIPIAISAPPFYNHVQAKHAAWLKIMPRWDSYSMETQQEIIDIYASSRNKSQWFPDSFAVKPYHSATIVPRDYYDKQIKTLLGNE